MNSRFLILSFFCLAITSSFAKDVGPEPLEVDSVKASAVHSDYDASLAVDGEISDKSRWGSVGRTPKVEFGWDAVIGGQSILDKMLKCLHPKIQ